MSSDVLYSVMSDAPDAFDSLVSYLTSHGIDCNVSEMIDIYRNHFPDIKLSESTRQVIGILSGIHSLAIITDGRSIAQRNKYKALGLDRFIPQKRLIISEEIGADKTTPVPFRTLMSLYPDEKLWIYIGDNPAKDFHYPNIFGWTTIMLRDADGRNIHPQTLDLPPEYVPRITINSLDELLTNTLTGITVS